MFVGEVFLEQIARDVKECQELFRQNQSSFGDLSIPEKFDYSISCLEDVQKKSLDALRMLYEMRLEFEAENEEKALADSEEEEQEVGESPE